MTATICSSDNVPESCSTCVKKSLDICGWFPCYFLGLKISAHFKKSEEVKGQSHVVLLTDLRRWIVTNYGVIDVLKSYACEINYAEYVVNQSSFIIVMGGRQVK